MRHQGLVDGALVRVRSRRGEAVLRATASDAQRAGQVFLPMHWGSAWWGGEGVNGLTQGARDPISRQPELKRCAVSVTPAVLDWSLIAIVTAAPGSERIERCLDSFRTILDEFSYASCGRLGASQQGVVLRAAHAHPPSAPLLDAISEWLAPVDGLEQVSYEDRRLGIRRHLLFDEARLVGLLLAGNIVGHAWLAQWIETGLSVRHHGAALLAPRSTPLVATPAAGRIVCTCEQVSLPTIEAALSSLATIDDNTYPLLQTRLKCGSGCGSCGPEIRKLIALRSARGELLPTARKVPLTAACHDD